MRYYLIIGSILMLLMHSSRVQAQFSGLDLLGKEHKKEIPFRYIGGFLVVEVVYGGLFQLNFLFDTGASHNILFKKNVNDLLGYTYTDTISIGGADIKTKMSALVSRNIPMQLEGTKVIKRDIIVLEEDFLELESVLGIRIDGILGGDFFKGLVLGMDHKKHRITIYNPNHFVPSSKFSKHHIKIVNYKPYIEVKTDIENRIDTLKYLIDSGASLALLIHSNIDSSFQIPRNVIIGNLGKGLGGDLTGYIGMINGLDLDQYHIPNVITSFQDIDSSFLESENVIRDGIIGNVILSRFHVIIDYMREILYLQEISDLDEEFEYDKSGMLIYAIGDKLNEYYVKKVYPNTPAEDAGILPGDKVLKIGFWPSCYYSLNGLIDKLQGKAGKKIKVKVLRNGKKLNMEFRLKDLFNNKS